jgi:tetrahydromethanopterin S-methyltransferase subunit B
MTTAKDIQDATVHPVGQRTIDVLDAAPLTERVEQLEKTVKKLERQLSNLRSLSR